MCNNGYLFHHALQIVHRPVRCVFHHCWCLIQGIFGHSSGIALYSVHCTTSTLSSVRSLQVLCARLPKPTCCVIARQLLPSAPAPAAASGQVGSSDALPPTYLHHRVVKQQTNIAVVHQTIHIIPGATGSPSIDIRHPFCILHVFTFFYAVLGTLKMALLVPLQGGLQKCHSLLEDYGLKGGKRV